jgi:hypothetical protein
MLRVTLASQFSQATMLWSFNFEEKLRVYSLSNAGLHPQREGY